MRIWTIAWGAGIVIGKFALLALSFRGSERMPTEAGGRLDALRPIHDGFEGVIESAAARPVEAFLPGSHASMQDAKCTLVMKSLFASMFGSLWFVADEAAACVCFRLEGVAGTYRLDHVFVARSGPLDAGAVEGDDLVFLLFFICAEGNPEVVATVDQRFRSAQESWLFLSQVGAVSGAREPPFTGSSRPGFYFMHQDRIFAERAPFEGFAEWLGQSRSHRQAISAIGGYLYYCWLICQRVERLAASISVNGDWDIESRKIILARKKAVAARQYALVKNRAEPDSHLLPAFHGISTVLRLSEQLGNVSELLDEAGKAIDAQNAYTAAGRLQAIEVIIFLSTVLGLGVALNAIQMPPFFDSTAANALMRREFWLVFATVACAAFGGWLGLTNGKRVRRLAQRIYLRFPRAIGKR